MSILSTLLKIGGAVAAPFSAGASLALEGGGGLLGKLGGAAGAAGSVMGAQQGGANNARIAQGQLDQGHDRNAVDLYQAQQAAQNTAAQTDLQRKGFESGNRSTTAKQALIGALLGGGVTPTSLTNGQASGGLLRSLNGNPEARAAMQRLGSQGSDAQQTPLAFQGGAQLTAPTLTAVPKIDTGGGTMGTLTKLAQIFGAVAPFLHKGGGSNPYAVDPE
jgi:hypothetical protein